VDPKLLIAHADSVFEPTIFDQTRQPASWWKAPLAASIGICQRE